MLYYVPVAFPWRRFQDWKASITSLTLT